MIAKKSYYGSTIEHKDHILHGKKRPGRRGQVCEKDRESVCNLRKAFNLPCSNCTYFEDCREVHYGNCK